MRTTVVAFVAVLSSVQGASAWAAPTADSPGVAIYWQPPTAPFSAQTRAAFSDATQPFGLRFIDATPAPTPPAGSLRTELDSAKMSYARFTFPNALAQLDALERRAEADGGGDLDARALADVFFYRWLCRSELGNADAAWDDLVQAARIDPARVIDTALLPPRAVAAWRRAQAEVGKAPRVTLHFDVPSDAHVAIDGATPPADPELSVGRHFAAVQADGYERWTGMIEVRGAGERLAPKLVPLHPPDADALLALAGPTPGRRLLLGALERVPAGWRFAAHDIALPDGKTVSDTVALPPGTPVRLSIDTLLRRLTAPPVAEARPPKPLYKRWWVWTAAGGGVVVTALAISLGVIYGSSPPTGTISLPLKGIK